LGDGMPTNINAIWIIKFGGITVRHSHQEGKAFAPCDPYIA
jgi:hypothetical protein